MATFFCFLMTLCLIFLLMRYISFSHTLSLCSLICYSKFRALSRSLLSFVYKLCLDSDCSPQLYYLRNSSALLRLSVIKGPVREPLLRLSAPIRSPPALGNIKGHWGYQYNYWIETSASQGVYIGCSTCTSIVSTRPTWIRTTYQ